MFNIKYFSEHEVFIDNVRKLCEKEFLPHLRSWESNDNFPNSVFETLGKQGYLGILIPEEFGGIGADYKLAGAWCETFGEIPDVGLSIAVNMHSLVISHSLAMSGTQIAKEKWLPDAVIGKKIGAYAFTEPDAGSDLSGILTRAQKKGSKWIINGAKTFITNGARADFCLVFTKTKWDKKPYEYTTFVVDTKLKGFNISRKLDKLGWRTSDTAELSFKDLEVDESCILGEIGTGWKLAMNNLNWERLMLTLSSLGSAKTCFRETLNYANERKAFGKSIYNFGVIKDILHEMYTRIKQGEALAYHSLDELCEKKDCKIPVALTKRKVCEDAIWIADRAIQIHGGYGYTKEFHPEKWWRDLRLMTIGGGTSEIMGNVVAKEWGLI